jgi:hypothetical protein
MNQLDRNYYLARIAAEQRAADHAAHPLAALSHRRLADEYVSLIDATDSLAGAFSESESIGR